MYHLISDMRALYVCTPNGAHFEIMSWVIQPCSFPCEAGLDSSLEPSLQHPLASLASASAQVPGDSP